ncbi:MAG TPA: PQQ-binding-like beta-propeller repeat protein, partial [Rhodanobacteraceae bacterium]|nr:PQQ-binding-like beta-propeller repeat protein [Rhodanobacteraceae bacterium]
MGLLLGLLSSAAFGQAPSVAAPIVTAPDNAAGRAVYETVCAACHARPEATKSPPIDTLRRMGPRAVSHALTSGKMRAQAATLTSADIDAVVSYLAGNAAIDDSWIAPLTCGADRRAVATGKATIGEWGFDPHNHRHLTAAQTGLRSSDLANLELAWALGFPQTANMRAQPAIVGNTLYLAVVDSGQLFAFDVGGDKPCVEWVYQHDVPLRTALGVHEYRGRQVLVLADAAAHVLMMDAATARVLWTSSVKVTSVSNVTAMPVLFEDRVLVPISTGELNMGAVHDYECCRSHGAVVALDGRSGEREWVYHTMEDAKPTVVSRVGTQQFGPSGAPIWTAAAVDEKRRLLYVGTGENTSAPATATSDAVLAIRIDSGELAWSFQATPNDIYLTGCIDEPDGPNCPPAYSIKKDWDFGAGLMLVTTHGRRDLVLAGQKNGVLWALDADDGKRVWNTKIGPGGSLGGIHWGMAYDGRRVYVPNNQS